jgi:hypothetical protein
MNEPEAIPWIEQCLLKYTAVQDERSTLGQRLITLFCIEKPECFYALPFRSRCM